MDGILTWLRTEWDRVAGVTALILGALALLLGYQGVSRSEYVAEQLAYLVSGGLGGLFLLGVAAILLLSADLQDEWRKLDRIEEALTRLAEVQDPTINGDLADDSDRPARRRLVAGGQRGALTGVTLAWLTASAVMLVVGWQRVADASEPRPALTGTTIATFAVVALGAGVGLVTLAQRRVVRTRAGALLGGSPIVALALASLDAPGANAADDRYLSGPGLLRYHRAGCPALAGVRTSVVNPAAPGERQPCGLCVGTT